MSGTSIIAQIFVPLKYKIGSTSCQKNTRGVCVYVAVKQTISILDLDVGS